MPDEDLVVNPFQWKGNEPTLWSYYRGASCIELGMQARELVGSGTDGNSDAIGCDGCRWPVLFLDDPTFSEPSPNPNDRDATLLSGRTQWAEAWNRISPSPSSRLSTSRTT
ncbi:MAG: hypothetical protein KDD47_22420 [Acidobacteria bacterium]|nr:hypothetical protein [Acidobacteriota bacterium]